MPRPLARGGAAVPFERDIADLALMRLALPTCHYANCWIFLYHTMSWEAAAALLAASSSR